jgi:hypothetical protein
MYVYGKRKGLECKKRGVGDCGSTNNEKEKGNNVMVFLQQSPPFMTVVYNSYDNT